LAIINEIVHELLVIRHSTPSRCAAIFAGPTMKAKTRKPAHKISDAIEIELVPASSRRS
jgi:hypothetical protein